jgi:hypothetical protein
MPTFTVGVEEVFSGETGCEFTGAYAQARAVLGAGSQRTDEAGDQEEQNKKRSVFVHYRGVKGHLQGTP